PGARHRDAAQRRDNLARGAGRTGAAAGPLGGFRLARGESEMRRYRLGFTFIELLCVIAIIAILAAILFPVFAQARSKARQTSCASNLQQLAIAANLYSQDHNGRFPPKDDDFAPLFQYVKNNAV